MPLRIYYTLSVPRRKRLFRVLFQLYYELMHLHMERKIIGNADDGDAEGTLELDQHPDEVRAATMHAQNIMKKIGEIGGEIGGQLRIQRTQAREVLTAQLIRHLRIPKTQTTAAHVMKEVFGVVSSTERRTKAFAVPGRRAEKKTLKQSVVAILASDPAACEKAFDEFAALNEVITEIQYSAKRLAVATVSDQVLLARSNPDKPLTPEDLQATDDPSWFPDVLPFLPDHLQQPRR